ncbi:MAG TPA: PIG-L family deacetylase [Longimicrobiales bacterium]
MTEIRRTLLAGLSHPDDEVGCAGALAAQVARGDRVVLLWLTRGSMTEALGPLPGTEVARLREEQGRAVAGLLGAEARFLDFEDTWVEATSEAAHRVARVLAELRPDGLVTWGDQWRRGPRHPDHQATGKIFRDAITLARIARVTAPMAPHRGACPVFALRGEHSTLPAAAVDVTPVLDTVRAVAAYYHERVGWPRAEWLETRLKETGRRWGVAAAEEFDAWESPPGLCQALI